MAATPVWIAAYGGPYPGATPMYRSSASGATPIQIVGYGVPPSGGVPSGVTPIWVSTPAASGAVASSVVAVGGALPSGTAGSTWSAADATTNSMTLSNGGMTAAATAGTWQSIRGTISKTSGKLYVEFLATVGAGNPEMFGLASSGFVVTNYLSTSIYSGDANFGYNSAGFTAGLAPGVDPVTNDVMGLAVDFATGNMWLARNNTWLSGGNPSAGTTPIMTFVPATVGALFPAVSINFSTGGGTYTLQPTSASQKYAPPSGFSPWG